MFAQHKLTDSELANAFLENSNGIIVKIYVSQIVEIMHYSRVSLVAFLAFIPGPRVCYDRSTEIWFNISFIDGSTTICQLQFKGRFTIPSLTSSQNIWRALTFPLTKTLGVHDSQAWWLYVLFSVWINKIAAIKFLIEVKIALLSKQNVTSSQSKPKISPEF